MLYRKSELYFGGCSSKVRGQKYSLVDKDPCEQQAAREQDNILER